MTLEGTPFDSDTTYALHQARETSDGSISNCSYRTTVEKIGKSVVHNHWWRIPWKVEVLLILLAIRWTQSVSILDEGNQIVKMKRRFILPWLIMSKIPLPCTHFLSFSNLHFHIFYVTNRKRRIKLRKNKSGTWVNRKQVRKEPYLWGQRIVAAPFIYTKYL